MSFDTDYTRRLYLFAELLQRFPHRKTRKLQREALKYYPLYYTESVRRWMSSKIAKKAQYIADNTSQARLRELSSQA